MRTSIKSRRAAIAALCALMMFITTVLSCSYSFAGTDDESAAAKNTSESVAYVSDAESENSESGNIRLANGVTREMCNASYWSDLAGKHSDDIVMTHEQISEYNYRAMNTESANMNDITNTEYFPEGTYNAYKRIEGLSKNNPFQGLTGAGTLWIEGKSYPEYGKDYFAKYSEAFLASCYQSTAQQAEWAVGTQRTPILSLPTPFEIGYSADDPDNENCKGIVDVNEPVVVRQKCTFEDHTFYYVFSNNMSGWVEAEDIAITTDRNEWLDAWQVDLDAKDFIVVTQDKITLESSGVTDYSSDLNLMLGTILKLVPDEDVPETIGERGTYNNYVVYLPTRDEHGKYVRKMAMISQHCSVSEGFLDYTQENVMKVAFSCLGNRLGWAGSDNGLDCTLYNRIVYRCMGLEIPRKTAWQVAAGEAIDVSGMSDSEKLKLISSMPAGTTLMFSGYAMIYTGTVDNKGYVISSNGNFCEEGTRDSKTTYSIVLNPLTVNRTNGTTWLRSIENIVNIPGTADIDKAEVTVKNRGTKNPEITASYLGKKLYEGINYTAEYDKYGNIAVLEGINNFNGKKCIEKSAQKIKIAAKYRVVRAKKLKKKAGYTRPIECSNAKGRVTFSKVSGSKKLNINHRTGEIRVRKNTKEGVYKIKVKASAAETWCYKKGTATKVIKVYVR